MDRYEVTNADFKKFVDAGGYEKPSSGKFRSCETADSFLAEAVRRLHAT